MYRRGTLVTSFVLACVFVSSPVKAQIGVDPPLNCQNPTDELRPLCNSLYRLATWEAQWFPLCKNPPPGVCAFVVTTGVSISALSPIIDWGEEGWEGLPSQAGPHVVEATGMILNNNCHKVDYDGMIEPQGVSEGFQGIYSLNPHMVANAQKVTFKAEMIKAAPDTGEDTTVIGAQVSYNGVTYTTADHKYHASDIGPELSAYHISQFNFPC